MWQFVKYSLATVFGLFLFAIVSLLLLAGVGAAIGSSDEVYDLKDNSVLRLDLNRPIVENASTEDNPFSALTDVYFAPTENVGLIQLLSALERAKVDPKIKGIYLDASFPMAGYAQLSEIREAIQKFQKSGKFVYAYANSYTEKGYYISSVADKTYLNPNGLLDFNGISVQYTFYKKALDKLDIEPLVFRVGTYKSAVEPFIREDMSEESKAQTSSFLQSINTYIFDKIARSKNIPVRKLDQIADSLQAFEPSSAEKLGMITQGYWDEFEALMKKASGEKEQVKYVSLNNYLKSKTSAAGQVIIKT
jgi:protease-4